MENDKLTIANSLSPGKTENSFHNFMDTEGKKTQYDSNSIVTSSSEDSENASSKRTKKRFDIEYKNYSRSKSTSNLYFKTRCFSESCPVVREEVEEIDGNDEEKTQKYLNKLTRKEGYYQIEENLSEPRTKKYTKSTKALSLMDPVVEVKEEIDFSQLREAPFKKLKCLMDFEEDSKFKANPSLLYYHTNKYETEEAIEEDNRENEIEITSNKKRIRYAHTNSLKKLAEFVDLSDMLVEQQGPHNIIEEAIKEDSEHEEQPEEKITNSKCKSSLNTIGIVKIAEPNFDNVDEVHNTKKKYNSTNILFVDEDPIPECAEEEKNCLED